MIHTLKFFLYIVALPCFFMIDFLPFEKTQAKINKEKVLKAFLAIGLIAWYVIK